MIERSLQAAVARAREESTRVRELLAELDGRRLAIHVLGTPFAMRIESTGTNLRFHWFSPEPTPAAAPDAVAPPEPVAVPDATVRGSPLALLALSGADAQAVINRGEVQIEGSGHIAQQFRDLSRLLRPDLEPLLGGIVGRSLAHVFMRGVRGVADWTRAAAWTQVQNLAEYLAHERGDLVPRTEAEQFLRGVDELREQLDRVTARLEQLEKDPRVSAGGREPA